MRTGELDALDDLGLRAARCVCGFRDCTQFSDVSDLDAVGIQVVEPLLESSGSGGDFFIGVATHVCVPSGGVSAEPQSRG